MEEKKITEKDWEWFNSVVAYIKIGDEVIKKPNYKPIKHS